MSCLVLLHDANLCHVKQDKEERDGGDSCAGAAKFEEHLHVKRTVSDTGVQAVVGSMNPQQHQSRLASFTVAGAERGLDQRVHVSLQSTLPANVLTANTVACDSCKEHAEAKIPKNLGEFFFKNSPRKVMDFHAFRDRLST
jgi:hypothetical protein